jgi:hypothetical protein
MPAGSTARRCCWMRKATVLHPRSCRWSIKPLAVSLFPPLKDRAEGESNGSGPTRKQRSTPRFGGAFGITRWWRWWSQRSW